MSSKDTKETNVLAQASILMVAGIVTRIIGVLYRSPVTSIIGDEGNGYYSIAVNIYTCLLYTSLEIFDKTKKFHGLTQRDRLILEISAILHDIGKYVNLNDPGKNGYQLIISTEIMGLSHREREEVANIVLYNTQELPDTDELDTAFWREEYLRIAKLSSILRLANALDRGHKQKLEK